MKIDVTNYYEVDCITEVELPEGKTMDDIEDVWFKWGEGSIEFKDGTSMNVIEEVVEDEYFKRPYCITLRDDESGNEIEFDNVIGH